MVIPELADLIWLFEDEPSNPDPDLRWPVGLQSFRLQRGPHEVLFSIDPTSGEAYITLYAAGQELADLGRLRRLEALTVIKRDGYEGLELRFVDARHDPLIVQTRPEIKLTWNVVPLGVW
ncbi:MAG TPA: hypothetical protein VF070_03835 [Streptosporangiaceae bacterium]